MVGRIESGGTLDTVLTNDVNGVSLSASDTLTLILDGSGAGGNGLGTFVGYNLVVELIPEPTSVALMGLGCVSLVSFRRRK